MDFTTILTNGRKFIQSNSVEILTAGAVSGVLSTMYFTAKGAREAAEIIRIEEEIKGREEDRKARLKKHIVWTWKAYIPAGVAATTTIGFILGATHMNTKRTVAAVTAYSLTEKAFQEYREHVVEQIGAKKEEVLRNEIAERKVQSNDSKEVLVVTGGDSLCCELFTGRFFRSDMETLRKAQNDINQKIMSDLYVSLDEFYYLIGLPFTSISSGIGWDSARLMELEFTSCLNKSGNPALAFDYNYTKPL